MTENQEKKQMQEVQAFMNMLSAAIQDAAENRSLTQILTEVQPKGMTVQRVRLIVVPDSMDRQWSKPLRSDEASKLVIP